MLGISDTYCQKNRHWVRVFTDHCVSQRTENAVTEYVYDSSYWPDYETGCKLEWCLTNGLGGYSGGSLIGSMNRTHQGYLVAPLYPPTLRYVTLERIREEVKLGNAAFDLDSAQVNKHGIIVTHEGFRYLKKVTYDDASISFTYETGLGDEHLTLTKTIAMKQGANAVAVAYDIDNPTGEDAVVTLTPLVNFRSHDKLTYRSVPKFMILRTGNTVSMVPRLNRFVRIDIAFSGGEYIELSDNEQYESGTRLLTQIDLEEEGLTSHFTPFKINVEVPAHSKISYSVLCNITVSDSIESFALLQNAGNYFLESKDAHKIVSESRHHCRNMLKRASRLDIRAISGRNPENGYDPEEDVFFNRLVLAADHFICMRSSTGTDTILAGLPWFTDWGRDTMIAFTGLTLCTRRYEEAGQILLTFAHYIKDGLIPNVFPDNGNEPMYNTADASLWYFIAVYNYIRYLKADSRVGERYMQDVMNFIRDDIFPGLTEIVEHYINGTHFSIGMNEDGLIHAGSDLDQVTWMDVRIDDRVITPRHGCPVEINALWFNALSIMEYLCKVFGQDGAQYAELAAKVRTSFTKAYWNDRYGCLYDVVVIDEATGEYTVKDDSIRPNQLFAISLPFRPLSATHERSVFSVVEQKLYAGTGIRTLSPSHKDYHGLYRGALKKRDEAYHQGTSWAFLLGAYLTAYRRIAGSGKDVTEKAKEMLTPIMEHMKKDAAIGGISEVFDGDSPNRAGGCYNQAWSVGEILRAYVEAVL